MNQLIYKKSTKNFLIMLFTLFCITTVFSQDGSFRNGRGEKIKQLKIVFFTEELNLSSSESEKFWPLYNELEEKIKISRRETKRISDELSSNSENLKDEDFKKNVNKIFDNEIGESNLRKEYYFKFAQIVGFKKATKILKLEKEFKKKLLQELKKRRRELGGK